MEKLKTTLGNNINSLVRSKELGVRSKDNLKNPNSLQESYINTEKRKQVQSTAYYLVEKLESPDHLNFFLKVAWRLSKSRIDWIVGQACENGRCKRAYFIALAKEEMKKN